MFKVNEDNSIYVTRGDIVYLKVTATNNGSPYTFQPGEVLRVKVYGKKDCENIVLQKDFAVTNASASVEIILGENDTKIGETINKPTDYWYEVELNPFDNPQTIIGYDEDGAKLFRLFPEGDDLPEYVPDPQDIPVVDDKLDMTSTRPVQNQVIARAFANLQGGYQEIHNAVATLRATPQMYGAVGDGVADDTDAFMRAMAENAAIYIPAGDYLVSDLTINKCEIIGARTSAVNIKVKGVVRITNTYYPKIKNVCFLAVGEKRDALMVIDTSYYGLFESVQFSNTSGKVNVGVHLNGSDFCYYQAFRSCVFNNLPIGVKCNGYSNAHLIDKCEFYQCETCVLLDGAENIRVTNNTFQTFGVCGVKIDLTGKGVPKSNLIMGNYFEADGNRVSTTYLGDIDFSNNANCTGNFILANHYTYTKARTHIVNMASRNMVLDYYTGQESNDPNTLMGMMALEVVSDEYKEYAGERFEGTIIPVREDDGSVRFYGYGRTDNGALGWQRFLTTGISEKDTVDLPPIITRFIAQYSGDGIQLGHDYAGVEDRVITFDTNQQLIKMCRNGEWEFYQKVHSGTTTNRPTWKPRGYMYYDSTLGKPIFSTGSNTWVDATGKTV